MDRIKGKGQVVKQMPMQLMVGLLIGAIGTELYYWKVVKIIHPGIND